MNKSKRDPAHAPGHRRLNLESGGDSRHAGNSPQNASALNRMSKSDVIATRNESRREIPGSSINAKGRDIGRVPMGGRGK